MGVRLDFVSFSQCMWLAVCSVAEQIILSLLCKLHSFEMFSQVLLAEKLDVSRWNWFK